ncbi:MAG: hypothetical protein IKF77_08005 [Thermoguttaceae bacterium]|nr:hypothetical protein [Thermoguttaceae bacterium]MBR3219851.1 hypothetical protein [Thermoguttaceae bacterium]
MKQMLFSALALLLPVLMLSGCSGPVRPDGMPDLVKHTVTVTQDGQPVEGVHLTLFLDGPGKNWPIFGDSDASGKVMFCTQSTDFKGAPAGSYIVTAEKVEITPSQYDNVEVSGLEEAQMIEAKRRAEYRPSYDLVNPELKTRETTTLTLSITASGCDPATLELGAACREMFIPQGSAPEPGIDPEDVMEEVQMSD